MHIPLSHRIVTAYYRMHEHPCKLRLLGWLKQMLGVGLLRVEVVPGVFMELDDGDYVQREILLHGAYEPLTLLLFNRLLDDATVFVDIGAHVGSYALRAARRFAGRGRVYAFEPTPANAATLLRNAALSGLDNLVVYSCGISDRVGLAKFTLPQPIGSTSNWGGAHVSMNSSVSNHVAPMLDMNTVLTHAGLKAIDVVKIDVEGHEVQVLRSLFATSLPLPRHILVEFKPKDFSYAGGGDTIISLLRSKGYELRTVNDVLFDPQAELPEDNIWARCR